MIGINQSHWQHLVLGVRDKNEAFEMLAMLCFSLGLMHRGGVASLDADQRRLNIHLCVAK